MKTLGQLNCRFWIEIESDNPFENGKVKKNVEPSKKEWMCIWHDVMTHGMKSGIVSMVKPERTTTLFWEKR